MLKELTRAAAKLLAYRAAGKTLELEFVGELNAACERTTAVALADAIGISPAHLCDVRKGRRAVTDRVLTAIAGSKT
jgi:hypothetical protein